ncbi:MAG: hypothetical protein K8F24_10335, partial [Bacteroidales bacterium]|nr:hypothetical protein [Bacteroidales bacterium]
SLQRKRQEFKASFQDLKVGRINITGVNDKQAEYIRNKFNYKSRISSLDSLKLAYMSLMADDKISYIFPELQFDPETEKYDLNLNITLANPYLAEVGGHVSSSATNQAFMGLYYRNLSNFGSRFGVNGYFGRFYSSVQAMGRIDLPAAMPFFLEVKATLSRKDYFKNANYFFEDPTPAFLINDESFLNFDMGHTIKKNTKVSLGFGAGRRVFDYYQTNNFGRNDTADVNQFDFVMPHVELEYNTLNRKYFPSAGMQWKVQLSLYEGAQKNIPGTETGKSLIEDKQYTFFRLKLHYNNFFAHVGDWHFGFLADVMATNQPLLSNYTATVLSAPVFEPVPEMKSLYLEPYRAISYAAGGFKVIYNPLRNLDVRLEGYVFQPYQRIIDKGVSKTPELGKALSDQSYVVSTRVVVHTPIGPLSASLNYLDKTDGRFSVVVSFGYLIFNRSAFE